MSIVVAALYQFTAISVTDSLELQRQLEHLGKTLDIKGLMIVASEGINGTMAGSRTAIDSLMSFLRESGFTEIEYKESVIDQQPFLRLNIKTKKEIVCMKRPEVNPLQCRGEYVEAEDWNQLISDPSILLIDTRNDYEVAIGKFKNAINPNTKNFSDFPDYIEQTFPRNERNQTKVAMYCTGGIRCEKASSYMKQAGFENVYHLKGGILKYLEKIPEEQSLWDGRCFVFDYRVSVGHGLAPTGDKICFACRTPLSSDDLVDATYEEGVRCRYCPQSTTDEDQRREQRNRERQLQIKLAKERNEPHIAIQEEEIKARRKQKHQQRRSST